MDGNIFENGNLSRIAQAKVMLQALKDVKLRVRSEKYKGQSADLLELFEHLYDEVNELENEMTDGYGIDYLAMAYEIADISNCCDLLIGEILDDLDKLLIK